MNKRREIVGYISYSSAKWAKTGRVSGLQKKRREREKNVCIAKYLRWGTEIERHARLASPSMPHRERTMIYLA